MRARSSAHYEEAGLSALCYLEGAAKTKTSVRADRSGGGETLASSTRTNWGGEFIEQAVFHTEIPNEIGRRSEEFGNRLITSTNKPL